MTVRDELIRAHREDVLTLVDDIEKELMKKVENHYDEEYVSLYLDDNGKLKSYVQTKDLLEDIKVWRNIVNNVEMRDIYLVNNDIEIDSLWRYVDSNLRVILHNFANFYVRTGKLNDDKREMISAWSILFDSIGWMIFADRLDWIFKISPEMSGVDKNSKM